MTDQKEELPPGEPVPQYPIINGDPDDDPQPKPGLLARVFAAIRRTLGLKTLFELRKHRPPIIILFDHLYSQYQTVSAQIPQGAATGFIKILEAKRAKKSLSWSDLYHFQLILADSLPAEQLRTKIRRLRYDYRSVAGEKEFDEYMASKPPDLQSPPQPTEDQTAEEYTQLLRDDLKDLLGRMYMEYAILPVKEERLTELTWVAARLCLYSLLSLLILLAVLFIVPMIGEIRRTGGDFFDKFDALVQSPNLASLTVFVVVVSGAIGGFVSALRRIQSPRAEGDSLYNLSLLFHGSYSVFVAPISGAIFAIILYLMFTSQTLMGTFFPEIYTPEGKFTSRAATPAETDPKPTATPSISPSPSPSQSPPAGANQEPAATTAGNPPLEASSPSPTVSPTQTPTPEPSPSRPPVPSPKAVPEQSLNVFDFLAKSGPAKGKDYALLIIWCFIAGFAERFVPDALDRLISRGKSGSNS